MAICGAKPHTVDMVSIRPDEVESVIYQTMAYCTREEPKSDMVWAARNRAAVFFQDWFMICVTSSFYDYFGI